MTDTSHTTNNHLPTVYYNYTPQEVVNLFSEQLHTQARVITLEGLYYQNSNSLCYYGYFYDLLRCQNGNYTIKVYIHQSIREKLKSETLVRFNGTLQKKINNNCSIDLIFHVTRYDVIEENVISAAQQQLCQLQILKSTKGFRNVDNLLESILFKNSRPRVCLLFALSSITDTDFKIGMGAASSHIDFYKDSVVFTQISAFITKLKELDAKSYDVIAIVRGGGTGISDTFNTPALIKAIVDMRTPLISGVGHPDEKPFIAKVVDKDLGTPSLLGVYFKDLVSRVIDQREKSKAVLVEQVKMQFIERINASERQNKDLQGRLDELTKQSSNAQKLYREQIEAMQKQQKAAEKQMTAYEEQTRNFNENISKMQEINSSLQHSLSKLTAQNTQAAKDLADAKAYAMRLEEQLSHKKKGCMSVIVILIILATGFLL